MKFNYPLWNDYSRMQDGDWPTYCSERSHQLADSAMMISVNFHDWSCICCFEDFDGRTERAVNAFPCLATGKHRSTSMCLPCADGCFTEAAKKCDEAGKTGDACTILYCPLRCCNPLLVQPLADNSTLLCTPIYIPEKKMLEWDADHVTSHLKEVRTAIAQCVTIEVPVLAPVNQVPNQREDLFDIDEWLDRYQRAREVPNQVQNQQPNLAGADVDQLMDSSDSSNNDSGDSSWRPPRNGREAAAETAMADIPQEITTIVVRRADGTHDDPVIID